MPRAALLLLYLMLALWVGGLASLFVFVSAMFSADRDVAVRAAPMLFRVFEPYQLALAAVAALSAFVLYLMTRSRLLVPLFFLVFIAALLAAGHGQFVQPRMDALLEAGEGETDEFKSLHGTSMTLYTAEAAVVLLATTLLPFVGIKRRETTAKTPAADTQSGEPEPPPPSDAAASTPSTSDAE